MSEISKSTSVLARLALFAAAMIWGSSFFIVKNATDSIPPNYLLALRFTIAFLLLCVIFVKKTETDQPGLSDPWCCDWAFPVFRV